MWCINAFLEEEGEGEVRGTDPSAFLEQKRL